MVVSLRLSGWPAVPEVRRHCHPATQKPPSSKALYDKSGESKKNFETPLLLYPYQRIIFSVLASVRSM